MRITLAAAMLMCCIACKSTETTRLAGMDEGTAQRDLPQEAQDLWDTYVQEQVSQAQLQHNCVPIQLTPVQGVEEKGLFIMYHGFSGCPIQFINVGRKLAALGYHVLLPLLPGQGRVPLKIDRAAGTVTDDTSGLPKNAKGYQDLTTKMNQIAAAYPGLRVIGGLSGGGAEATGTAVAGYDATTGKNLWDRALLMVPLYKVPGLPGDAADIVNLSVPTFDAGFGKSCMQGELDTKEPRNGICDFKVADVEAMEGYGAQAATSAGNLKIPVQIVAVEGDTAVDDGAIYDFYKRLASMDKALCYYPKGVAHAMLYEGDYLHPDTRPWVPDVEAALISWVTEGQHTPTEGISVEYSQPLCKLTVALPKPP